MFWLCLGFPIHATDVSSRGASTTSLKWTGIKQDLLNGLKARKGKGWVSHWEDYQPKLQHVSSLASILPPSKKCLCLRQRGGVDKWLCLPQTSISTHTPPQWDDVTQHFHIWKADSVQRLHPGNLHYTVADSRERLCMQMSPRSDSKRVIKE